MGKHTFYGLGWGTIVYGRSGQMLPCFSKDDILHSPAAYLMLSRQSLYALPLGIRFPDVSDPGISKLGVVMVFTAWHPLRV